jgi:WD40 repeat protein
MVKISQMSGNEMPEDVDIDYDGLAIASNGVDQIALSTGKTVSLFEDSTFETKEVAMKFESNVRKLNWTAQWLLGISEDNHSQVYNSETKKVYKLKPETEGSAKNGAIDPNCEFVATVGCDASLDIFKLPTGDEIIAEKVKSMKLLNVKSTTVDSNQNLECSWTQDGKTLLISGQPYILMVSRDTWIIKQVPAFSHKQDINLVKSLTPDFFMTAGLDKQLKVWSFET